MRPADQIRAALPPAAVEDVGARGRSHKIHRLSSARFAYDGIVGALHYQGLDHRWQDIDTTLRAAGGVPGYELRADANDHLVGINPDLSAPWAWEIRRGAGAIRLKPLALQSGAQRWDLDAGALAVPLGDDGIRWVNAFGPGIHLEVSAWADRVEKRVILDHPLPLTADLDLDLAVEYEGFDAPALHGRPRGLPLFESLALAWPHSWDGRGHPRERDRDGELLITPHRIVHRVSRAWLEQAQYPVAIDAVIINENCASGWDSAETYGSGGTRIIDSDYLGTGIFCGNDTSYFSNSASAWRFTGLPLRLNYTIDTAYMRLLSAASKPDVGTNRWWAAIDVDHDSGTDFSGDTATSFDNRFGIGKVDWDVADIYAAFGKLPLTTKHQTPEIKTLINNRLNDPSWAWGGNVCLHIYWDDTGVQAEHNFGDSSGDAELHVEWSSASYSQQPDATAGKDTYLDSYNANSNYGFQASCMVRAATVKGNPYVYRALVDFDLTGLPDGIAVEILTAKLTLYCESVYGGAGEAATIHRLSQGAWTETGATWNKYDGTNSWTSAGGDYTTPTAAFNTPSAAGSFAIQSAAFIALVQDAVDSRSGKLRLLLRLDSESTASDHGILITTSDGVTVANRPKLELTYAIYTQYLPMVGIATAEALPLPRVHRPGDVLPFSVASLEAVGTLTITVPFPQTLTAAAIASDEGVGVVKIASLVAVPAIDTSEALGAPALNLAIVGSAVPSDEAFGSAALSLAALPAAILSAEAVGTPALSAMVNPLGVASAEAMPSPSLALWLTVSGVASAESVGPPVLYSQVTVIVPPISSSELIGGPIVTPGAVTVTPAGVASTEGLGLPALASNLVASAISSGESFGQAAISLAILPGSIASSETTPGPQIALAVAPATITTAEAVPAPALVLNLRPPALAPSEAFGSPSVVLSPIVPAGVASAEAVGLAVLYTGVTVVVPAITSSEAVPSPTVTPGAVTVQPAGIASAEAGGVVHLSLAALPAAIGSAEAIGAVTVTVAAVTVAPAAIASQEAVGSVTVTFAAILPAAITSGESFGLVTLGLNVGGLGVATAEAFGTSALGLNVGAPAVTSGEAFGSPYVYGGVTLIPGSIASAEVIGAASLRLSPIVPTAIDSSEAIGSVRLLLTISPAGVISGEAVAAPIVALGAAVIGISGILTVEAFGVASITGGLTIPIPVILLHGSWMPVLALAASYAPVWHGNAEWRPRVELAAEVRT